MHSNICLSIASGAGTEGPAAAAASACGGTAGGRSAALRRAPGAAQRGRTRAGRGSLRLLGVRSRVLCGDGRGVRRHAGSGTVDRRLL